MYVIAETTSPKFAPCRSSRAARLRLVTVFISLTTLDDELKRVLEPRAASPAARLRVIRELTAARVPVGVLLAPLIPALNDHEIERLLESAAAAGAGRAASMMLRLPHELGALFEQWLREHYPSRAERVLNLLRESRGGRLNDPRFGHRMRGEGPYAELLSARFKAACRRYGLNDEREAGLDTDSFVRDPLAPEQRELFS